MSDLSTKYLGLNLKSPLLASASPLSESLDNIKRLEDHGLAGVVLPSLFEEQLALEACPWIPIWRGERRAFQNPRISFRTCRPTTSARMGTWS